VRDQSIVDIWQHSEALKVWKSVVLNDFNECGMYSECSYCQLCPGMAMTESNDVLGKSEKLCRTAKVRRDIDNRLRNGEKVELDAAFGHDLTFREPAATQLPALVSINHSGGDFVERIKSVKAAGNPIRQTVMPEPDSPAGLAPEIVSTNEPRFYETGK
jgi:hypothetical protein